MKPNRLNLALTALLGACGLMTVTVHAQFDPDVGIFDAEANGAGPNSGSNQRSGRSGPMISASGIPIGGGAIGLRAGERTFIPRGSGKATV